MLHEEAVGSFAAARRVGLWRFDERVLPWSTAPGTQAPLPTGQAVVSTGDEITALADAEDPVVVTKDGGFRLSTMRVLGLSPLPARRPPGAR
jgi:hypothetical protein